MAKHFHEWPPSAGSSFGVFSRFLLMFLVLLWILQKEKLYMVCLTMLGFILGSIFFHYFWVCSISENNSIFSHAIFHANIFSYLKISKLQKRFHVSPWFGDNFRILQDSYWVSFSVSCETFNIFLWFFAQNYLVLLLQSPKILWWIIFGCC